MMDGGFLAGQRCELLGGDLIDKMGQKPAHAFAVCRLQELLARQFGANRVRGQVPIEAGAQDRQWSLPEPDVAVLAEAKREYESRHPRGDELLLVIEVADSSVRYDSTIKRDLYARAGVPEYWVLDLTRRSVAVHRGLGEGAYASIELVSESGQVTVGADGPAIAVAGMLPEQS